MGEERDNPIIGYLLIDRAQRVIGPAAKGLVEVCRQQGIKVKAEERWRIKGTVEEAVYSSRALVGSQTKGWVKKGGD